MRFILQYNYGFFQNKSERINIDSCRSTDDILEYVQRKLGKKAGEFILRCKDPNDNKQVLRITKGWQLQHYQIKEGAQLEVEILQKKSQQRTNISTNKYMLNLLGKQRQQLNHIPEEEQNQHQANSQVHPAFDKRKYLDGELDKILKCAQKGRLHGMLNALTELPQNADEQTTIEIQKKKPKLLNELGEGGWGAIHFAVYCNRTQIIAELLKRGVDPNRCTTDGWLPLQLGIHKKNLDAVNMLIRNQHINVNQSTAKGTALHIAAKEGYLAGVEALILAGADWRITDQKGKNSIDVCANEECALAINKFEEQRSKQEEGLVSIENLAILKGAVYKVKTVFLHLSERYMVVDPYKGSLVIYESESKCPKHPKQTIPIEQIHADGVILLVGDRRTWQMKKDYHYFELLCSKRMMFACKHLEVAIRWVSGIQQAIKYSKLTKMTTCSQIPQDNQIIVTLEDKTNKITSNKEVISTYVPPASPLRKTKASELFRRSNVSDLDSDYQCPSMPNKLGCLSISSRPSDKTDGEQSFMDSPISSSKKHSGQSTSESLQLKMQIVQKTTIKKPSPKDQSNQLTSQLDKITTQKVNFSSFEIIKQLGSGNFGKVFLAKHIATGKLYALKALKKKTLIMKKQIKYAVSEAKILKQANHPFIINLHYAFQTPNYLYLALDYCSGKDLSFHIAREITFGEDEARKYIAQLILAIEHLHSKNIVYRDLKPENVLLDGDGHIKLGDFGLSKDNVEDKTKSFCGSPAYLAPEVVGHKGASKQTDLYGIGTVLYELLIGQSPFYSDDIQQLYANIVNTELKFPKHVSSQAKSLITGLMNKDPKKRIGAKGYPQLKAHPFFKNLDWKVVQRRQLKPPVREYTEDAEDSDDQIAMFTNQNFTDKDYEQNQTRSNRLNNFSFVRC